MSNQDNLETNNCCNNDELSPSKWSQIIGRYLIIQEIVIFVAIVFLLSHYRAESYLLDGFAEIVAVIIFVLVTILMIISLSILDKYRKIAIFLAIITIPPSFMIITGFIETIIIACSDGEGYCREWKLR